MALPSLFLLMLTEGPWGEIRTGGIAQMARAMALQAIGLGFESPYLQNMRLDAAALWRQRRSAAPFLRRCRCAPGSGGEGFFDSLRTNDTQEGVVRFDKRREQRRLKRCRRAAVRGFLASEIPSLIERWMKKLE